LSITGCYHRADQRGENIAEREHPSPAIEGGSSGSWWFDAHGAVFISHEHGDEALTRRMVMLLRDALNHEPDDT
jgi:hypothetical protein